MNPRRSDARHSTRSTWPAVAAWCRSRVSCCRCSSPRCRPSTSRCGARPACSTCRHMGEIWVTGPRALDFVQHVSCNDASKLARRARPVLRAHDAAGDLRRRHAGPQDRGRRYLLVVNASNTDKDFAYLSQARPASTASRSSTESDDYAQIAIQGPRALEILQPLTAVDLAPIKYYWFACGKVLGAGRLVARTGYTGEDGFEVYLAPADAPAAVADAARRRGAPKGLMPAGLGARDTLRLEASMALYGNDIDDTTTAARGGPGLDRQARQGRLHRPRRARAQQTQGVARKLVGFEMDGPRHRRGTATRSCAGGRGGRAWSPRGPTRRPWARPSGMAYCRSRRARLGPRSRSTSGASDPGRGRSPAVYSRKQRS